MGRQRYFGNRAQGVIFISETASVADVVDGEIITIGNKVFEFDDDAVVSGSNVLVDMSGSPTAAAVRATLIAAINANKPSIPVSAVVGFAEPALTGCIIIQADAEGDAGHIVFTTTMITGTSAIDGLGLLQGGENGSSQKEWRACRIVEDEDVLVAGLQFDTGLDSPRFATAVVRDANGVEIAWDGELTRVGREVRMDNGGSVDWAAGHEVVVQCWE